IQRRMAINHLEQVADYLNCLQEKPAEVEELFQHLLIGVSGFFRDPEAFRYLEEEVLPQLIEKKDANTPLRVWVPGCATGEEPYSIAMLLGERLLLSQKPCDIQIFSTDIDARALGFARRGTYPESIAAQVSPERLERFFSREGKHYRVNKQTRKSVIFAMQNLITDPAFSRLDLICCRNLLIYLEPQT